MFDFRWKELKISDGVPPYAVAVPGQIVNTYRVLQFRHLEFFMDAGGAVNVMPPRWTEWQDVGFGT